MGGMRHRRDEAYEGGGIGGMWHGRDEALNTKGILVAQFNAIMSSSTYGHTALPHALLI